MSLADLPNRRYSLAGTDLDGHDVEMAFSISKKLYRCPGCRRSIPIGSEHVVVRIREDQGQQYHQHWHRDCAHALKRTLRAPQPRPVR